MKSQETKQTSSLLQFIVLFVIPLIILTRFSGESQLGPTKSLLLALAFPVAFEIYNITRRKKFSILSFFAIGGILVTGAISLLGLSEGWLAIRRGAPYLAMSIAILILVRIKHPIIEALLPQILDMEKITDQASKKRTLPDLKQKINHASYLLSALLFIIAVASYVLTRIVIVSSVNTTAFNQEYARLRVLSLPIITLPLLIGIAGIMFYLITSIEKLSGLDTEDLMKKK